MDATKISNNLYRSIYNYSWITFRIQFYLYQEFINHCLNSQKRSSMPCATVKNSLLNWLASSLSFTTKYGAKKNPFFHTKDLIVWEKAWEKPLQILNYEELRWRNLWCQRFWLNIHFHSCFFLLCIAYLGYSV